MFSYKTYKVRTIDNQILVIFGASGDLTKRKLIPALYELHGRKQLPEKFAVVGAGRTRMSNDDFRTNVETFLPGGEKNDFLKTLYYEHVDTFEEKDYEKLKNRLKALSGELKTGENYIFYLSTPPAMYEIISQNLFLAGLSQSSAGFRRVIIEKPFGSSLETARNLNVELLKYFDEEQIYRIDHYLGKETVQNMLVIRFSNGIFEPIWNQNFIHHIEITSTESLGVESRGRYYDHAGALRDMVQNHLLQLVGFVAMEPPSVIEADAIRNEILKVFQALRPITESQVEHHVIRGQYTSSTADGKKVLGYREEENVSDVSRTETYAALRFYIDNWRWAGVPFYVRTGKKLPVRVTEIVVHFKQVPHRLFGTQGDYKSVENQLIIRIQPDEGLLLKIGMKIPGAGFHVQTVDMSFNYKSLSEQHLPTAYERLLLDCMQGDATLYTRGDAVEEAWKFVQPILNAWENNQEIPLYGYEAGTWGPANADKLIVGGAWRCPCKDSGKTQNYCKL